MSNNPFAILGIRPEILSGKDVERIEKLVQSVGRVMSAHEHPDAGGNARRFNAIQEARGILEDPEKLLTCAKEYLRPRKDKVVRLEAELGELAVSLQSSRDQFRSYLEVSRTSGGVFDSEPIRLRILDTVATMATVKFNNPNAFSDYIISGSGMVKIKDGREVPLKRVPIGCVREGDLHETRGIKSLLLRMQPSDIPAAKHSRLSSIETATSPERVNGNRFPWELAGPVLDLLCPELEKDSYLFSFLEHDGKKYLYFDGKIVPVGAGDA